MDPALQEIQSQSAADRLIEVLVKLRPDAEAPQGLKVVTRFGDIATGRLQVGGIQDTWDSESVTSLKAPRLVWPEPMPEVDVEGWEHASGTRTYDTPWTGEGVVVGVIDWGFDFTHPNFLDPETEGSRLLALWDQSAPPHPSSGKWGYGRVFQQEEINLALGTPAPFVALGYDPRISDPDGTGSHGTHVLDIAAGNGTVGERGMAPGADIVVVHLGTQSGPKAPSLGDSGRILEAIDFISQTASGRPVVINMSIGKHGGSHVGKSLVEQGMDQFLTERPGRMIVNSAGNYYSADIHATGHLNVGQHRDIHWQVSPGDATPNEMEIWYPNTDRHHLEIRHSSGSVPPVQVELGLQGTIQMGDLMVGRAYHRRDDPNSPHHHIDIYLYPAAPKGTWIVRLVAQEVVDGHYHAWVERDSAGQSRLLFKDVDRHHTTGSICNGFHNITVGAYDSNHPERLPTRFSSAGPTVDGRLKPNLVAPGAYIAAARSSPQGSSRSMGEITLKSGTSMAAPHVTGSIALLFQAAGRLLAPEETRQLLVSSVSPPPSGSDPFRYGQGYLDTLSLLHPFSKPSNPMNSSIIAQEIESTDGEHLLAEVELNFPLPGTVNERHIALYSQARTRSRITGATLRQGESVTLLQQRGDYYKIQYPIGSTEEAWVRKNEIHVPEVAAETVGAGIRRILNGAGFDPVEWYRQYVSATFLGLPINRLIHQELATHLQRVEQQFVQQHGSIASAREAYGLTQEISGSRTVSATAEYSYHIFGLAVDIERTENPYLGSRTGTTRATTNQVFQRIGNLLGGRPINFRNLPSGTGQQLERNYDHVSRLNEKVITYFGLMAAASEAELSRLIQAARTPEWAGLTVTEARAKIETDLDTLAAAWSRASSASQIRRRGFLTHARDFVTGMEMDWGGWYGDMMHFDLRNVGTVGTAIERAKQAETGESEEWDSIESPDEELVEDDTYLEMYEAVEVQEFPWEVEPQIGWPDASATPARDHTGKELRPTGWNASETPLGKMRRIPIMGLTRGNQTSGKEKDIFANITTENANGRAIVWIHSGFRADRPATLLLLLHGVTIGYRQNQHGQVEDVANMQLASQLENVEANLITILPQGSTDSQGFGKTFEAQEYCDEVIETLVKLKVLSQSPAFSRRVIAGYSGGGNVVTRMLDDSPKLKKHPTKYQHQPPSSPFDLILIDAIHIGEGYDQANIVWKWIKAVLDKTIQDVLEIPSDDLLGIGGAVIAMPQFTGYHTLGSYKGNYAPLVQYLEDYLKKEKRRNRLDPRILEMIGDNIRIVSLGHWKHLEAVGMDVHNTKYRTGKPIVMAMTRDWSKLKTSSTQETWDEQFNTGDVGMVVAREAHLHTAPAAGLHRLRGNPVIAQSHLVRISNRQQHNSIWYVEVTELAPGGTGSPLTGWMEERKLKENNASALNWATVKHELANVAVREFNAWSRNGLVCERASSSHPSQQNYWDVVGSRPSSGNLSSAGWQEDHPWSAAFISYVVNEAGIGNHFFLSAGHACYIAWARQNRLNNYSLNPFWAYAATDAEAAWPEPGDILCKNREGGTLTVDSIRCGNISHCDIVVEVDRNLRRLITIGGNVDNRVARRVVHLDANGFIDPTMSWAILPVSGSWCTKTRCGSQSEYMGVIKVRTTQPAASTPAAPSTTTVPAVPSPTYRLPPESYSPAEQEETGCGCASCSTIASHRIRPTVTAPVNVPHLGQHSDCLECAEYLMESWQQGTNELEEAFAGHPSVHAQWVREAYDNLAYSRGGEMSAGSLSGYKIVMRPGESLRADLLPGDLLIARNFGAGTAEAYLLHTGDYVTTDPVNDSGSRRGIRARVRPLRRDRNREFQHEVSIASPEGYLHRNMLVLRRLPTEGLAQETATATLTVEVRTDFMRRSGSSMTHDWANGRGVQNSTVEIEGQGIQAITNRQGVVQLPIHSLPDGNYAILIQQSDADKNSPLDAGPLLAESLTTLPDHIYKPLRIDIELRGGRLVSAAVPAGTRHGGVGNRLHHAFSPTRLPVDWKPSWSSTPNKPGETLRTGGIGSVTGIIVHHTAGRTIGSAYNTFRNAGTPVTAHYLVDLNGHVIKLKQDKHISNHAGCSRWRGQQGMNATTIGIEIVNRSGPYPQAQMDAVISLLEALTRAYSSHLPARNIFGHSDIAILRVGDRCSPSGLPGRKEGDPGTEFDWAQLESRSLGMVPSGVATLGNAYGDIFATPDMELRQGDRDSDHRYGGHTRPTVLVDVIRELQGDLSTIGYAVDINGTYDPKTVKAVRMFQHHFFSASRRADLHGGRTFVAADYRRKLGRVNLATATMIKRVLANIPSVTPVVPSGPPASQP